MKTLTTLLIALAHFMASHAYAQAEKQESDKLDMKKLEQKYWSAKDDDFSVVQNRAFSKANRYFIDFDYGLPINDPYQTGYLTGLTGGYYFSERWGMEVSWMDAQFTGNGAFEQFVKEHKSVPNHNVLQETLTVSAVYIPFYAKMSFLDRKIIYFDMGFALGAGVTKYDIVKDKGTEVDQKPHYSFDVIQHFFFSEHMGLRINLRNKWTNEERARYRIRSTESESARPLDASVMNDTQLIMGITYWF